MECSDSHGHFSCQRPLAHAVVVEQTWWLPWVARGVNDVIVSSGPLLPYLLLATQLFTGTVEKVHNGTDCPSWLLVLLIWVFLTTLRIIVFICVHPYNFYFSDHIFLLNSVLAQIEMSLAMTLSRQETDKAEDCCKDLWILVERLLAYLMISLMLFEAFITSWLYHTVLASWLALAASSLLFQVPAYIICQQLPGDDAVQGKDQPLMNGH